MSESGRIPGYMVNGVVISFLSCIGRRGSKKGDNLNDDQLEKRDAVIIRSFRSTSSRISWYEAIIGQICGKFEALINIKFYVNVRGSSIRNTSNITLISKPMWRLSSNYLNNSLNKIA